MKKRNACHQETGSLLRGLRHRLWRNSVVAILLVHFSLWSVQLQGAVGYWIVDANGNWTGTPGNWLDGFVPNGAGDIAVFRNDLTATRTITLNAPIILGGIRMSDALGGSIFTLTGNGPLTLNNNGADAKISKYGSGTDVLQTSLFLQDRLNFNINVGTLDVTGPSNAQVLYNGSVDTIKTGPGQVRLNINTSEYSGNWRVQFGTMAIGGANSGAPYLGAGNGIFLEGNGRQDLAIFGLYNNGVGSDSSTYYSGNNDVYLSGGARITVDRNYIGAANDRVTHVLDNLTLNGGILQVTSGNQHNLRFDGQINLLGQTVVFDVSANSVQVRPNLILQGVINDGDATRSFAKDGAGRLLITGTSNTYDGLTAVRNGVLALGPGANLGSGGVLVNGGILALPDLDTFNQLREAAPIKLVAQLGTSRYALPVLANSGFDINETTALYAPVPIAGMALAVDAPSGGVLTSNIDLAYVGTEVGVDNRVWLTNVLGADHTFQGTLLNSSGGDLRLTSGGNTLIISGNANRLGGDNATNGLTFGYDHATPINYTGNNIINANAGTVSVRVDNSLNLGPVTVHRGITVNINGTISTPLGLNTVYAYGGTINTDNTSSAQFGNARFELYGGSTLLLDNSNVTSANTNRRLRAETDLYLSSSTLRLLGDGGAATVSSQTVNSIEYIGGATISVDTDGTAGSRRTTLTTGSLIRSENGRGTLNVRNIAGTTTTFGTASGTQKLIVTNAPTVTNGMIGADVVLWGGTAANDAGTPLFATYDATNGLQAATFTHTNFTGVTTSSIVNLESAAVSASSNPSVQALRVRSTANTNTLTGGTVTIGAAAGAGQGAGLFLAHTAGNGITHTSNFTFGGNQEGLIYVATPTSGGIITLSGVLAGTNGVTRFGDGILALTGANTFSGPLTLNSGETRIAISSAGLVTSMNVKDIEIFGGSLYLSSGSQRYPNNVVVRDNVRYGNVNVANSAIENLIISGRGSTPTVLWVQNQAGSNGNIVYGGLQLNGAAQFSVVHWMQINGPIRGWDNLDKYMNERLYFGGDSPDYWGAMTIHAGSILSFNSTPDAKPFGWGPITVNPGGLLRIASVTNVNDGQVTLNSDWGGIAALGLAFVTDPYSLPEVYVQSTSDWKGSLGIGAWGFRYDIDQSTLWGGETYLGSILGDTGVYTGVLSPADGGRFLLGTGQGTLRIARPLTGADNRVVVGVSMAGDESSRLGQTVNNVGGAVQFDVPMSYDGTTTIHLNAVLRLSARDALTGTGDIELHGGVLYPDSVVGQLRMIAPQVVSNNIVLTGDSALNMQNNASDVRYTGTISLAPGSNGVIRQITLGVDQPGAAANNAGNVYADGGIIDGAGGSGNHLIKAGAGTLFLTGVNTYSGSTTVSGGLLAINSMEDFGNTTSINLTGGGLAIWENSVELTRDIYMHGGNGHFDVLSGLTLTQTEESTFAGTSSLIKRGLGTMILNGSNSMTGINIYDGVLQVNLQASLGDPAQTTVLNFGGDLAIGGANNATRYTGGTLRIHAPGEVITTNRGASFNNNTNTNFGGGIDVTEGTTFVINGAIVQGTELDYAFLTGPGTLVTTGTNTWRQFAITNGTLQFGHSAPWSTSNTSGENLNLELLGGVIHAVNPAANINYVNQANTTSTFNYGGGARLRLESGGTFSAAIGVDNLIRLNQGTLVIETGGDTTLGTTGDNTARVVVTNAINTGVARASAMNNGIFAAHLIGADSEGHAFFLENEASNGFRPYSGSTTATLTGLSPTSIADVSEPLELSGTANSRYAVRVGADIQGGSLRITAIDNLRSGGLLINGSHTIGSNLVFDPTSSNAPGTGLPAEALVYVKTGELARIDGDITTNALTKFGLGTLTLAGSNLTPGEVSVQSGILQVANDNAFSRLNAELNINAGAALDLNGHFLTVETLGGNNRLVANAAVAGTVTNSSDVPAALMVAGPIGSTWNGVLELNTRLVKSGAGALIIQGFSASSPNAGNNTYTGGTDIYGIVRSLTGGSTTNGSTTVTVASTAGLVPGALVQGANIPNGAVITSITSATQFTLSVAATGTASSQTYTTTGGITLNNTAFGLGGYGGSTPGDVNLYSGVLSLLYSNGNTGINSTHGQHFSNQVIKIGAEEGDGITLNVYGPGLINVGSGLVSSHSSWGQGNILQVGAMNMSNTILQLSGAQLYRLRVAGTTTLLGSQATFQTNSDGPNGALELFGKITGAGAINKLGDGSMRGIVIANPLNDYTGGTNIIAGDVQVTSLTNALGSGPVRVYPEGTLRIAGNESIIGDNLTVMSRVNALGAVTLDNDFTPSVLTSSNFSSVYNTTLQLGVPYFNQALDLATIGDGRAFMGSGLGQEARYMAPTLGAGVPDAWNPGVGVYRLVGGHGGQTLGFDGVDNVLTGNNFLQVGTQRQMVLGGITNSTGAVVFRNSNNFTGGTQITEGAVVILETGGSPIGETPLGSGPIEIYGELRVQSSLGSLWKADTEAPTYSSITLRPAGLIRLIDNSLTGVGGNLVAGGQGRWGDAVPIDLNGGQFRLDGAPNWNTVETIGDVTVRKGGILSVFRNSTASSAQLNVGDLTRVDRGTLTLNYNNGFLGLNTSTPRSYERLTVTSINGGAVTRGGTTTNGSGVVNSGMVAPWIVDRVTHSHVGYDPTGAGTGFQPLLSAAPGAGQLAYNKIISGTWTAGLASGSDLVSVTTGAKTLADNPSFYALRSNQNISPTATFNTITLTSGGLLLAGGTINPVTSGLGVVNPMTINFGAGGSGEALIYVGSATSAVYAQINATQGLTKFGPNQLSLLSINPGIGGPVVINESTLYTRVPFSGSGQPVPQVFNGQDVILNAGALVIEPFIANATGTVSEIASGVRAQALFDSNIFVRGDSTIGNNGQAQYVRIADLTIGNADGAPEMNGNGVISLALQSGIWVRGTTTLAPEARFNATFNGFSQSTFAGVVTGPGGIEKFGNGAITLLNPDNNFANGITIWASTNATAVSTVASAYRGVGTPFSTGVIQIQPGGVLRVADNANIASNPVYLRSDAYALGGFGLAHNGGLPEFITSGEPTNGQIKIESTGPYAGVLTLDYGFYNKPLDMAAIPGGSWWLGNSQQAEAYYFNSTLGAAANGKYLLGGGGNQSGLTLGAVHFNASRTTLFEGVLSGGVPNEVRVEIGTMAGDFTPGNPSMVNGNAGYVALTTRNPDLIGDIRVNINSVLAVGNNFALGQGRLIINGGNIRTDFGNNNFLSTSIVINNDVVLSGDYNATAGGDMVMRGTVSLSDVPTAGATRTFNINVGTTGIYGSILGAPGSNLIKTGATTLVLGGINSYQGYTQVTAGTLIYVGDVLPNTPGALGLSDSPVVMAGGSLTAGGKQTFARDLIVNNTGTFDTRVHNRLLMLGGISTTANAVLTLGAAAADVAGFRGGLMEIRGPISGAGSVVIGTTAAAPAIGGTVYLAGNSNGYGISTYAGGTTLQSARIQVSGSTYYSGPANNPTIISGPFGTGTITFGAGESNRGFLIEAVGGPVEIANALGAITTAANTSLTFGGHEALTFTRDLNLNSDATLRNRTFAVQNVYQPVTFSGNLSASGAAGVSLIKNGAGMLILTGTNTFTTSSSIGITVNQGILRISSDSALGANTTVRLGGGVLSVAENITTSRVLALHTAASGVDVAAGKTLTLSAATTGAFGLIKTGPGTLFVNATNAFNSLTIGGQAQLNPDTGMFSGSGGIVATTAVSGSPFGTGSITIHGGVLGLVGGASAQALSVGTINYGANAVIGLIKGTSSSQLTITSALNRQGAFNSVNYGVLTVVPSELANLGVSEKLLISAGAPGNTATGGGNILTTPSIFIRLQATGSDANFARYDSTGGVLVHNVGTVNTLTVSASGNVADITTPAVAGVGNIDIQALRTQASIDPTDVTTLIRISRGGLIINGNTASILSAPMLFGTGTGGSLTEAIVYVREDQTGVSAITGGIMARDFTKAGPGVLEIGGTDNYLNSNGVRLPVLSIQDGTLRFADTDAAFLNINRPGSVSDLLGNFVVNVNDTGVLDLNGLNLRVSTLTGNGTVSNSSASPANISVSNGLGVDTTFNGRISDGAGVVSLTKSQNGTLILAGHGSYSGGTYIQAGRVTNATGSNAAGGILEARTVTSLGTGGVILQGGTLRLNAAVLLGGAQTLTEVTNAIDYLLWGGPNGLDITVSETAYTNGILLPANMTSTLRAAAASTTVPNVGIGNLTIHAPMLSVTEGLYQVLGTMKFNQESTILRVASGRLFVAGKLDAAGKTIIKIGGEDIVLTNPEWGDDQNQVGLWKLYGGILEARTSVGSSNPLGVNPVVEINVGSTATNRGLRLYTDGDGTGLSQMVETFADTTIRFGSMLPVSSDEFVSSGTNRVQVDRAFIANNSFKTVKIASVEVGGALGSPYVYFVTGNSHSTWVDGPTTFIRDMAVQVDGGSLVLNGPISGNGTFNRRSNGGTLFINSDNSDGYNGGTFFVGSGRNYFGSVYGNQVTLSDTAKLGKGHVFQGPLAMFQINSEGNLQEGQNIYVAGNLNWFANFSLAADLTLEQVRLRALGLGGVQNGPENYYLSATNPSAAVLSIGTTYTHPLNMRMIGDGMWYLGSITNGVGANGIYDAPSLEPGLGNTYRLGSGGSVLFVGTSGHTNVLTDVNADAPSSLVVGTPVTVQNFAPISGGTGSVVLLQNQNYTGRTLVNMNSTLDFRGTMATSEFDVYGTLNVAGEGGTLVRPDGSSIPVTLRPGSLLRLDNTSSGVLPLTSEQGRWGDETPLSFKNGVLRLQGNAAVEVAETVGAITVDNGGNRIEVVRGVIGRGIELRTPSITRENYGTLQFVHNGSQLGSDERVIITGGDTPVVTNGMVEPWMVSNSDLQFVTYNPDTGFTIAGFDYTLGAAVASTLNISDKRLLVTGAAVPLNGTSDIQAYALRLSNNITLGTVAANTATQNRVILGSGGLIVEGARTMESGLWAGVGGDQELIIYNNNTFTLGRSANPTTSGRIKASSITKTGAGTFLIVSEQPDFSGDIRIQQGAVQLQYTGTANTDVTSQLAGDGGSIIFQGNNTSFNLRIGNDSYTTGRFILNNSIVLGDDISVATINLDRAGGSAAASQNKTITLQDLTFGQNSAEVGQVLRILGANGFRTQFVGTVTLNGRSAIGVDNNYNGTAADTFFTGKVTGDGMLIKGPSDSRVRTLFLQNVASYNDWTDGTLLLGGTLQVLAIAPNVAANAATNNLLSGGLSSGPITLMGGTLDLRVDAPNPTTGQSDGDIEFIRYTSSGPGQDVYLNGSATINVDRNVYQGTYSQVGQTVTVSLPGGHDFVLGQALTVSAGPAIASGGTVTAVTPTSITYTTTAASATVGGAFSGHTNTGTTKMIVFNNLTMGTQFLTTSAGNSYGIAFEGTTTLLGNAFINNNSELVLGGGQGVSGAANSIVTDGGQVLIHKIGTSTLWIHSTNNTLTGPVYVNAGLLAFGNRAVGNTTATLGTGTIHVNPGAQVQIRSTSNLNTAQGQQVVLTGTQYAAAIFRSVGHFTQEQLQGMIKPTNPTTNQVNMLSIETTYSNSLNLSSIANGRLYLSASGDRVYQAASLAPGLPNLPNSVFAGTSENQAYRFTHQSGNTLSVNLSGTGNLTDYNGLQTDVHVGNMAILGPNGNLGSNGYVYFQDQNTYTGQTIIARSMTLRFNTAMSAGDLAGPLGANGDAVIDVYGGLRIESGSSVRKNDGSGQFYTNIRLHPTSTLTFQDMAATGNNSDRWDDATGIYLDGAAIVAEATSNVNNNSETVGAITFDRGSRILLATEGTGDAFLTAASIARAPGSASAGSGRGTMVFSPSNSTLFGVAAQDGRAETQLKFTEAPVTSAVSNVPNMLPGYYMESTGNRFVSYGANGVTPVLDAAMVAMPSGAGTGKEVVNVTANTTMGSFETTIYALRGGGFTLSSPSGAGNDATIILGGSGADVGAVASYGAFTINPNLKFGVDGANEAIFYTGSTLTVNGFITAGSITKYGIGGTLVIANDQSDAARGIGQGYSGGWVVNEGTVQFGQFGSAGNAVASNTIVLNGARAASAQLNLRAQPADTLLNYTYTSGRIYAVDFATIDWDPGADDRVHSIADLEILQSGGAGSGPVSGNQDAYLRFVINRNRSILSAGSLTITSNAVLNVDSTVGTANNQAYSNNSGYLTTGVSTGLSVSELIGTQRLSKWGDGYLYIRGASPNFSGTMVIDQGAVHVTNNNSLGSGPLIINRYGTLDIGVANFVATNESVTYNEGSLERWSVDGARSGYLNLGLATLQIAANQPTTNVEVTLNGGGIEAWLRGDDVISAQSSGGALRVLNPNIRFNFAADSFVGTRYYLGANGLDMGKQTNDNRPMEEYLASGAILEIQGVISGVGGLTKAGMDVVILSGSNTYQGPTFIESGRLLVGRDNALPVTTSLSTTANGILDLNGQNQTVGKLSNPVVVNQVNVTSGYITNSATVVKTLTVGNGAAENFTYSGVIQHNVALTKTGPANMTLTNANTYLGGTRIEQGTLTLAASGSIHDSAWLSIGPGALLDVSAHNINSYLFDGVVLGGGVDPAGTTFASVVNAGRIVGNLTIGNNIGNVSGLGHFSPGEWSGQGPVTGDGIGHLYISGNLTLNGGTQNGEIPSVNRLTLQLAGPTTTLAELGYTGGSFADFIDSLSPSLGVFNGTAGNLTQHDYIRVEGDLSLSHYGQISIALADGYSLTGGEVFNLLDWTSLVHSEFDVGPRNRSGLESGFDLNLPALSGELFWDTSRFLTEGVVIVVPEPGRMLLLLVGLMVLGLRRRRQAGQI